MFLNYSQQELDDAYDQRGWAPNFAALIAGYATDSAKARDRFPPRTLRYGPASNNVMDVFLPPEGRSRPVFVFIHGGAWRSLTRADSSAAAPMFLRHDVIYVAPDFPNIPAARLPDMLDALQRAMLALHRDAASLGGDPRRIVVAGHSSGAHLAALLLTTDWRKLGGPRDLFRGGMCLCGIYELAPVVLSARGTYLKLSDEEVAALSPIRHLDRLHCPVAVGWGTKESPEFIRQGREFAAAVAQAGHLAAPLALPEVNHFEMPVRLTDPNSELAVTALRLLGTELR